MYYKSPFLTSIFIQKWTIDISPTKFKFEINNVERTVPLEDIVDINISRRVFFCWMTLRINGRDYLFKGLAGKKTKNIKYNITHNVHIKLYKEIIKVPNEIEKSIEKAKHVLSQKEYISQLVHKRWVQSLDEAVSRTFHPFFQAEALPGHLTSKYSIVKRFSVTDNEDISSHNETFIKQTQLDCKKLFDKLEEFPLSEEQTRAVIINADRQLLVAAAGSGKSATIAAKAIYLIDQGLATSEEILVLAYNKDAQTDIEDRLKSKIGISEKYITPVRAKTFHGLGLDIIKIHTKKKPSIAEIATTGKNRQLQIFNGLIQTLITNDKKFARDWQMFITLYLNSRKNISSFTTKKDYDEYLLEIGGYWKGPQNNQEIVLLTLDGKEVKSMEELQITNWLVLNGISYDYERSYEHDVSDEEHRQYMPDFYYPEADLYHEHFAIDKNGKAPVFFDDYEKGVLWKRRLHKQKKTTLIETHSADFTNGSVFSVLENALDAHGITCKSLSAKQIDDLVGDSFSNEEYEIFLTFLRHFKMNNLSISDISLKVTGSSNRLRNKFFVRVFEPIYKAYQDMLESSNQIDFEDQIHHASKILEDGNYKHGFKYLLVDEFQDLSQDRKRLILALLKQNDDIHLFGVGDDWQSIYRFSGADIDLMTHFDKHFGKAVVTPLTKTYRSYQGIVDIASKFIMKNPGQLKKDVTALDDIDSCQVNIINVRADQSAHIESLLDSLNSLSLQKETRLSVYILGRYNFLIPENFNKLIKIYRNIDIAFKTVHASKGLEADYVILLNLESGKFGFPSAIDDDPVLDLVIPTPEEYPHAEERRLMYVAITRAKRGVFLLSNTVKPSPFTTEISKLTAMRSNGTNIQ